MYGIKRNGEWLEACGACWADVSASGSITMFAPGAIVAFPDPEQAWSHIKAVANEADHDIFSDQIQVSKL